jgi:iron complex outermembrane receptor protein
MKYNNQLVLTGAINDVGAYTRTNIPNSYRAGIELQAAASLKSWLNINGNLSLSKNKIKSFTEYIDDYDNGNQKLITHTNTNIAFSPNVVAAADIAFKPFMQSRHAAWKPFELNLLAKHVGRQYLDNTSDKSRSIDDYTLVDLRARYVWHIKEHSDLIFTLAVYNTLNRMYVNNGYNYSYISGGQTNVSNYYYPQAGRYFLAGIGYRF